MRSCTDWAEAASRLACYCIRQHPKRSGPERVNAAAVPPTEDRADIGNRHEKQLYIVYQMIKLGFKTFLQQFKEGGQHNGDNEGH